MPPPYFYLFQTCTYNVVSDVEGTVEFDAVSGCQQPKEDCSMDTLTNLIKLINLRDSWLLKKTHQHFSLYLYFSYFLLVI